MNIMLASIFLLAAWKWGDWRNWERYYSTYLFMLAIDFAAGNVTFHHTLWHFEPDFLTPNHSIINFLWTFTIYPATILLFLPYDSKKKLHGCLWIGSWAALYSLVETIISSIGLITYENGWSLLCSVLFDIVMFTILRIHFHRPGWAWLVSFALFIFVWIYFDFSIEHLKL